MAKQTGIIQLQGTIGGIVFVSSSAYGAHTRSVRGSKKPATLNASLQAQAGQTALLNTQASAVHKLLSMHSKGFKEGGLWQQMQQRMRRAVATDPDSLLASLNGLELNSSYPLTGFMELPLPEVQQTKEGLQLVLTINKPPVLHLPFNGCRYQLVVLFFDKAGKACVDTVNSSLWMKQSVVPASSIIVAVPDESCYWLASLHLQAGIDGKPSTLLAAQGPVQKSNATLSQKT